MKIGFISMNGPCGMSPADLARAVDERGYDSLWMGEHCHLPASGNYGPGIELPPSIKSMMDPYIALGAAAQASTGLWLGTGIALPLHRHVLMTANQVATVDVLSGGRFIFGIGAGWNAQELANLSPIPWAARYRAIREYVAALKLLWTEDEPSFDGEFIRFEPVISLPKPVQRPHPPIAFGVTGPIGMKNAAEWADIWFPEDALFADPVASVGGFRRLVEEAGRDPADVAITVGTFGLDRSKLDSYRELGVERVNILPTPGALETSDDQLRFLDANAHLICELA